MNTTSPESKPTTADDENESKPKRFNCVNFDLSPTTSSSAETDTEINEATTTIGTGTCRSTSSTTIVNESAFYCNENLLDIMPLHVEQILGEGRKIFKFGVRILKNQCI